MIVAANWKMHKTLREARQWTEAVAPGVPEGVEAVVFPPFTALAVVHQVAADRLLVGAQNVFYEDSGAFTGEISPAMVLDCGCTHVLVGHSERRHVMGESDRDIAVKLRFVLGTPLVPMLCVGDTLEDFERGDTAGAIRRQLGVALKGLSPEEVARIVVAYEPVWAIGTGRAATIVETSAAATAVVATLERLYGGDVARGVRVVYGGSVTPENVRGYLEASGMDGVLVGSASLDADVFQSLMQEASMVREATS